MRIWRIGAGLAALCFFLTSVAAGADLTYSGVPGKWKRTAKGAKDTGSEAGGEAKEDQKEKGQADQDRARTQRDRALVQGRQARKEVS